MANFRYNALNSDRQQVAGELQAENLQQAIDQLEARELTVQSIAYAQSAPTTPTTEGPATDEASARVVMEQTILGAHLAHVLEGAKTIAPALRAYCEELPVGRRRRELEIVIGALEGSDDVEAEKVFAGLPEYWIPLLSAATSSRDPGRVLQEFLSEAERTDELRRQWWLTISYPLFILCVAGAVLALLSVLVVPLFANIFREFCMELPAITLVTIRVASLIARVLPYVLIGLILFIGVGIYLFMRWPLRSTNIVSRVPAFFFGRATAIARFSQFLADLLEAGLSVPDTLRVAGFLTTRKRLQNAAWRLADQLQIDAVAAQHIKAPRGAATIFHALRSEMSARSRVSLLREISKTYAAMASRRLSWTRGVIEPLTILAIGFVVAGVVVSLFLPLIKLIEGLTQ
jgi:type IV pilus assembly protein PilC